MNPTPDWLAACDERHLADCPQLAQLAMLDVAMTLTETMIGHLYPTAQRQLVPCYRIMPGCPHLVASVLMQRLLELRVAIDAYTSAVYSNHLRQRCHEVQVPSQPEP